MTEAPTEVTVRGMRYRVVSAWPIYTKYKPNSGQTTKRIGWGVGLAGLSRG